MDLMKLRKYLSSKSDIFSSYSSEMDEQSSLMASKAPSTSTQNSESKPHSDRGLHIIVAITATASVVLTIAMIFQALFGEPQVKPHGAVATSFPECSRISLESLKKGGSAVDAAISAAFCLTIVAPYAASVGGGGIMMIHHQSQEMSTKVIDFSETVPQTFSENSQVGVPGFLEGLSVAHARYGKLNIKELIDPTIKLAMDGFKTSPLLVKAIEKVQKELNSSILKRFKNERFEIKDEISYPDIKEIIDFYEVLKEHGLSSQRNDEILKSLENTDDKLTLTDMNNYHVMESTPISISYKDKKIFAPKSPSRGPILIQGLKLIEHLKDVGTKTIYQLINTIKVLLSIGQEMPNLQLDNNQQKNQTLSAKSLVSTFKNLKTRSINNMNKDQEFQETSISVAIVDDNDLFVSMTLSLGGDFGSKIETSNGIILNNALRRFPLSIKNFSVETGMRLAPRAFPIVVIPNEGLCGMRFAMSSDCMSTQLEFIANMETNHLNLEQAARSNLVRIDGNQPKISFEVKDQNGDKMIKKLRFIGFDVEKSRTESNIEVVGKFIDDINFVVTEPEVKESAIKF